ncbi:MAG: class I SAM-dependent rRNA methyltransferase [Kofleriaceae bacterium]|nr:class I SAM-dependent rRNA methyltransferase [Kofleriaceae bacterium]
MLTQPRRYQLKKSAAAVLYRGQPWIFRDHLSSAAATFADGQWLRLFDGNNTVVGYGMYQALGAIAIRVMRRGTLAPTAQWIRSMVDTAALRRAPLRTTTNAIRWISGESDGLPAVVVEQFADIVVAQSYSRGADVLTRIAARAVQQHVKARDVLWRPARRRVDVAHDNPSSAAANPTTKLVHFSDAGIPFVADIGSGQKTGTYLDLRGLRHAITAMALAGQRVLNLFAYSGMLARCAERAGAKLIVNVDSSATALAFARQHHCDDVAKQEFITADIFQWLYQHHDTYDLVIVDPPAMTSRREQVPGVLATYRRMYQHARTLVSPNGTVVAACCTGRITRAEFTATVTAALGSEFALTTTLAPEPDHPVSFDQADYLKILLFRRVALA